MIGRLLTRRRLAPAALALGLASGFAPRATTPILCNRQPDRFFASQQGGGDDEAEVARLRRENAALKKRLGRDGDRMEALDEEMRGLLAPHYRAAAAMLELPSAYPSQADEWDELLAASALCCAGLVGFLKERFDDFFVAAFNELLAVHYPNAERVRGVGWEEAERALRRQQVSGGLTLEKRRQLFEEERLFQLQALPPLEFESSQVSPLCGVIG